MTGLARSLLLVPARNEWATVGTVVQVARRLGYDVCVVDDCSDDATADSAEAAGAHVVRLPVKLGVGAAVRCGLRWALAQGYDTVVQVRGDGRYDPEQVKALLAAMGDTGADMVIGSRVADGAGPVRRLAMRLLSARVRRVAGVRVVDASSEFRAIRRPLLDRLADSYPPEYHTVGALIAAGRMGAKIVEQPIVTRPDRRGSGRGVTLWYLMRAIVAFVLFPRRERPLRLLVAAIGQPRSTITGRRGSARSHGLR